MYYLSHLIYSFSEIYGNTQSLFYELFYELILNPKLELLIASSNIYIGKNSTLAYRTLLTTNANPNAPYNLLSKVYPPIHKDIWIGSNVWIGAGVIVLPGCKIGNNCVVAAGSVVCRDIPDNVMVAGVPAKIKKKIEL